MGLVAREGHYNASKVEVLSIIIIIRNQRRPMGLVAREGHYNASNTAVPIQQLAVSYHPTTSSKHRRIGST